VILLIVSMHSSWLLIVNLQILVGHFKREWQSPLFTL
jgi:hypothetical protein